MEIDRREYPSVGLRVVVITNLTRNVAETHLKTIFGFYGDIMQIDLPTFGKSGQNRGKAALEYFDSPAATKAVSHMDGGQIDGAVVKVELSDLPEGTVEPTVQDVQGVTRSTVAVVATAEVVAAHLVATPIDGRGRVRLSDEAHKTDSARAAAHLATRAEATHAVVRSPAAAQAALVPALVRQSRAPALEDGRGRSRPIRADAAGRGALARVRQSVDDAV
uniref:RNA-binding domain-containing protein n=1 Tax=Mycena chlorophos TaxID=658473 RepID=A0ABQ0LS25_MYCCL|nr:RNA-binding domain-containing protein [Mycena chlorophos]